jgi:hypothetical protein
MIRRSRSPSQQASPAVVQEDTRNISATNESFDEEEWDLQPAPDARPILPKAAFFLGDLRDGLPMVRHKKKLLPILNSIAFCAFTHPLIIRNFPFY